MGNTGLGYLKFKTFYVAYVYIKYFRAAPLITQKFSLTVKETFDLED
jgi:hypothetical protein